MNFCCEVRGDAVVVSIGERSKLHLLEFCGNRE